MTVLTEMFGIKGDFGDMMIEPKLLACQFDKKGMAGIRSYFAQKKITVIYENIEHKEFGDYKVEEIYINEKRYYWKSSKPIVEKKELEVLKSDMEHVIRVKLA
jgi:hypothetical protein